MMLLVLFIAAGLIVGFLLAKTLGQSQSWFTLRSIAHADLRRIPCFKNLSPDHLDKISRLIREVRVPAGAYVLREHHAGDALYLVVSGSVNILKRGALDETLVQTVGPGEFIGEMALICGVKRIASAKTSAPSILIHIDRDDFAAFLAADADVAQAVWDSCDRHAMDLLLRDHEKLRGLSLEARAAWIASRRPEFHPKGVVVRAPFDGYLGVVSGALSESGQERHSPALLPCVKGQELLVSEAGRLVWLVKPENSRAAA